MNYAIKLLSDRRIQIEDTNQNEFVDDFQTLFNEWVDIRWMLYPDAPYITVFENHGNIYKWCKKYGGSISNKYNVFTSHDDNVLYFKVKK
jgi:hypothetical protein